MDFRSPEFDAWYKGYPRPSKRPEAEKAWKQKIRDGTLPPLDKLLDALKTQQASAQWQDKSYIPYPASYLRGECWNDVLLAQPRIQKPAYAPAERNRIEAEINYDKQFEEYCRRSEQEQGELERRCAANSSGDLQPVR